MTEEQRSYAVDRVEADRAILIGDHDGRALEEGKTRLERLKHSDPGGDIKL